MKQIFDSKKSKEENKAMPIRRISVLMVVICSLIFLTLHNSLAVLVDNPNLPLVRTTPPTLSSAVNYSLVNVNNSQYLQSYQWDNAPYPSALYSTYNSSYVPYSGAVSDVNLNSQDLIFENGWIKLGDGVNPIDTNLYRTGAGQLYTDALFSSANIASGSIVSGTNTGDVSVSDTSTVDLTLTGQLLSADVIQANISTFNSSYAVGNITTWLVLRGRSGGQKVVGGTQGNDDLYIDGTSNATRTSSYIFIGSLGGKTGIGAITPSNLLDIGDSVQAGTVVRVTNGYPSGPSIVDLKVDNAGGSEIHNYLSDITAYIYSPYIWSLRVGSTALITLDSASSLTLNENTNVNKNLTILGRQLFRNRNFTIYSDGVNLILNTNGSSGDTVYVTGNVSAKAFITRTDVYDSAKYGKALDRLTNPQLLINQNGKINYTAFGYSYTQIPVSNKSNPIEINTTMEICENRNVTIGKDINGYEIKSIQKKCRNETTTTIDYPIIYEDGNDLVKEASFLRSLAWDLKVENQELKSKIDKICAKEASLCS